MNLLSLLLLVGCAHRNVGAPEVVRRVQFEGNGTVLEGTADFHLRKAMEQEKSPASAFWLPWVDLVPLDRTALGRDAWRIEVWYAHHGYFDARFSGWDIQTRRPRRGRRAAVVDVKGYVHQGPASTVRSIRYEGMDVIGAPLLALIRRNAEVTEGDRFDLDAVKETEEIILQRLREASFARATLTSRIEAYPEDHVVDVVFVGDLGPPCRFGPVTVQGYEDVPESLIHEQIVLKQGQPYKSSLVSRTRQQLFSLGTFSVVSPRLLDNPADPTVVPVDIKLSESKFQSLKLGAGLGIESGSQDLHLSSAYQHTNLFHRLHRLELDGAVGLATQATFDELTGQEALVTEPTVDSTLTWTVPHFFGQYWKMSQSVQYDRGLDAGYGFESPTYNPSVTWSHDPRLSLTSSWRFRYYRYLRGYEIPEDESKKFFLSVLEEKAIYDDRDDPLFTRRGVYLTGTLGGAGGPFGSGGAPLFGDYNYVRLFADARMYRSLVRLVRSSQGWVLAGRLAGGLAVPYGDPARAVVPLSERFLLGGATTVRGWVTDRLGPHECSVQEGGTCVETIPTGGEATAYGSLELRVPLRWGMGLAGFYDAGMVWAEPRDILDYPPLSGAGGGFRYASPIGPVRVDLGFRLDHAQRFQQEPRWNLHFSLSEAF